MIGLIAFILTISLGSFLVLIPIAIGTDIKNATKPKQDYKQDSNEWLFWSHVIDR